MFVYAFECVPFCDLLLFRSADLGLGANQFN